MDDYTFRKASYDAPLSHEMDTDEIIDIFIGGHHLTSFHKTDISDELFFQLFDTGVECTNCTWHGVDPNVVFNQDVFCPKCGCLANLMENRGTRM